MKTAFILMCTAFLIMLFANYNNREHAINAEKQISVYEQQITALTVSRDSAISLNVRLTTQNRKLLAANNDLYIWLNKWSALSQKQCDFINYLQKTK